MTLKDSKKLTILNDICYNKNIIFIKEVFMKLLKNIFIFILAFLFCLFMFTGLSIALGKKEITDYFMILSLLIAVITPVITTFFSQYNYAMSMKHQIASKLSDIKIIEERSENLLTQFNKAIYEAREHEDKMALKSI